MENTNYTRVDKSISMLMANVLSIGLTFPIVLIPSLLFVWIWNVERMFQGFNVILERPVIFLLGILVMFPIHELIHGISWQLLTGYGRETIQYGIMWKTLTPYAHLKRAVDVKPYRWGAAMPGIILGVLPTLVGFVIGNGAFLFVGIVMLIAASGDLIILIMLRNVESPALVEDHPTKAGCYVLVPED